MRAVTKASTDVTILDKIGNTPLVPLARLNERLGTDIWGKCEFLNPGGSGKDRIAKAIVLDAEQRSVISPGSTIVEATAGNTGLGLALVAAVRGYRLVCVMPEKMCADKRWALEAAGAEVIITPNAPLTDPRNFRQVAARLAVENGWFPAEQFDNPANPKIHEETTGPEILEQCYGPVGAFVCGVGTGGTITGVGRYLKLQSPNTRIVLADPFGSRLAHLVDSAHPDHDRSYAVEGIGSSSAPRNCDLAVIDEAIRVDDEESFKMTRRLIAEEGLFVGGSSGTVVAAALKLAESGRVSGAIVVLLADSWDRYLSRDWMHSPPDLR